MDRRFRHVYARANLAPAPAGSLQSAKRTPLCGGSTRKPGEPQLRAGPVRELLLLRATACSTRTYGLAGRVHEWTAGCLGLRHGAAGGRGFTGLLATWHWASFGAGARSCGCGHAGAWGCVYLRISGGAGHLGARIGVQHRATVALGLYGRLRGLCWPIDIAGQQAGAGGQAGDDQNSGNQAL